MPTQTPMPAPPLDGVPPSPPGVAGGGPNPPQLGQLSPGLAMSGSMQVVQLSLQAATEAAKLIDLLGQVNPSFAPLAQSLIEQMRAGLKSTLQQGASTSEPSGPMPPQAPPMPAQQAIPGAPQAPLPPMGAGFGQ